MRTFYLKREIDISGMSGTGRVAEGIVFDDGSVAVRWLTQYHTTELSDNIETVIAVHGHGGMTVIEWID